MSSLVSSSLRLGADFFQLEAKGSTLGACGLPVLSGDAILWLTRSGLEFDLIDAYLQMLDAQGRTSADVLMDDNRDDAAAWRAWLMTLTDF